MCLYIQLDKLHTYSTSLIHPGSVACAALLVFLCARPAVSSFPLVIHLTQRHVCTHLSVTALSCVI